MLTIQEEQFPRLSSFCCIFMSIHNFSSVLNWSVEPFYLSCKWAFIVSSTVLRSLAGNGISHASACGVTAVPLTERCATDSFTPVSA